MEWLTNYVKAATMLRTGRSLQGWSSNMYVFTMQCTLVQSTVLQSHVVRLSVRPSVTDKLIDWLINTSCACQTIASQSRYSVDNLQLVPVHSVDLSGATKIPSRRPRKSAGCSHPLSASTHKSAQTGSHNARKQSSSSKMQESRFSSRNVQSARERPNLLAISASGRVIAAQGSATPESGSTLTNSCTDDDIDIRSVVFDGAVQSVTLVDCDHIGWKSWKLIAWTISPTPLLFQSINQSINEFLGWLK